MIFLVVFFAYLFKASTGFGSAIVMMAFGAPKQELLIDRMKTFKTNDEFLANLQEPPARRS